MDSPPPQQPDPATATLQLHRRFRATRGLKIALAVGTVVFCIATTELALQLKRRIGIMKDTWWKSSVILHRKSVDPVLVYEFTPDARALRQENKEATIHTKVAINGQGFRDLPFPEPPPPHSRRIVVLGDSVAWGWGVAMEEAFPKLIEKTLAQEAARTMAWLGPNESPTIVYNLAVDGYSTTQEVRMLELRGLPLHPDLIVVAYVLNDPDESYDAGLTRYYEDPGIELLRPLANVLWKLKHGPDPTLQAAEAKQDYSRLVHARYYDTIEKNFRHLGEISKSTGTPILIAFVPAFDYAKGTEYPWRDLHQRLASLATGYGLACFDLAPAFDGRDPVKLSYDIWHPTAEGHQIIADALTDEIRKLLAKEQTAK